MSSSNQLPTTSIYLSIAKQMKNGLKNAYGIFSAPMRIRRQAASATGLADLDLFICGLIRLIQLIQVYLVNQFLM